MFVVHAEFERAVRMLVARNRVLPADRNARFVDALKLSSGEKS
jgi:hypothetical protein